MTKTFKLYKIKHKPTGMYYSPVKNPGKYKTHLTSKGKLYYQAPSLIHIAHRITFSNEKKINGEMVRVSEVIPFKREDWEIETYTATREVCNEGNV
jgi:hypothetical protein